jgi:Flp pilus assembly pilin Flp
MRRRSLECESGQVVAEYVLILAGISVALVLTVAGLGGGIRDLFDANGREVSTPPRPAPQLVYPVTPADCADPGWRSYPQFESEEECLEFFEAP